MQSQCINGFIFDFLKVFTDTRF